MKNTYLLIILLFAFHNNAFAQDFQWVRQFEGSYFSGENANLIEVDNDENTYTFGTIFEPLFDIDPTANGTEIIDNTEESSSPQCGLFLTKLDVDGNFVWGKVFGSLFGHLDRVRGIEIGSDGNIYLLADIWEETSFFQKFITIFKIDPSGNILMTKKISNLYNPNEYDEYSSSSLALDDQNNIFITGSYKYHFQIDFINPQLNFTTGGDSFLLKIDNAGNILWGKKFDVLFTNTHYESVKIDVFQNPVVVASNGDNQNYTNYGYNIFKINTSDGTTLWQKFFDKQYSNTFNIDNLGNIIIAGGANGSYDGDIDVDPNESSNIITPTRYVLWLDNNGSFMEVKQYLPVGANNYFLFSKIEIDSFNNTYIVGEFNFIFDANPSESTFLLSYSCGLTTLIRDAFYIKFDSNRNFENAFKLGDYNSNCVNFYFTDFRIKNDSQYYVGNFVKTADFDPSGNVFLGTTNDVFGARFTLKLGVCDTSKPIGNSTQTFCSSQDPTVSNLSPNSTSIKWYDSLTSSTQLSSTTSLISGQTYYASKQIGNCPESQRLAVTAIIRQSPAAPILTDQTFCESENATLSDLNVAGQNIKWYSSITETTAIVNTTILQNNFNYYATQTVNGCESNRELITVTINSVSKPSVTNPQTFCIQQNSTINSIALTGQNIKWYDAEIGGNQLLNSESLVNGQTYYASQTIDNCESLRAYVLINIQNTAPPIGVTNQTFCSSLSATVGDIVVNGTNLTWYTSNIGNSAVPNTTLLVNGATYYVSQIINNCESVDRLGVTVNIVETLDAVDYSEMICDNLNDGFEIINFSNYSSNLISNFSNFTFDYYFTFLGATNQIASNLIPSASSYNLITGDHTFFVRITSTNGCHQIVKLNILLLDKVAFIIDDTLPICENSTTTIDAGSGFDSYLWSTGSTLQNITITNPGNYSVVVTKNYGTVTCSNTKIFSVVLSNVATITNLGTNDWTENNNTITVDTSLNSYGNYEYSLDGINYQDSNVFYNLINGLYTVYVRDKNGCGISEKNVVLLMYSKFFTPNGDGINDLWKIKFSNYEPTLKVAIFDRYGKLLKILNHHNGWDGKYNGHDLPSTDYWFVVTRANGKEHRGHFTLKR